MEYKRYKDLPESLKGHTMMLFAMDFRRKDKDKLKDFLFDERGKSFTIEEVEELKEDFLNEK